MRRCWSGGIPTTPTQIRKRAKQERAPSSKSYVIGSDQNALLTFLVLDLALDVVNSVGRLNLQSDGLASQGLNENLHAA